MAKPIASRTRKNLKANGPWLLFAVGIHALLILMPLPERDHPPAPRTAIVLSVLQAPAPETLGRHPDAAVSDMPEPRPIRPPSKSSVEPFIARTKSTAGEVPAVAADPAHVPDYASLLESAMDVGLSTVEEPMPRRLGRLSESLHPLYRRAPSATPGTAASSRSTVVNRWMAADGSHNLLLRLPNGQSLCGRARPWNPLEPLVEHPMMFRPCGNAGRKRLMVQLRDRVLRKAQLADYATLR